MKHENTHAIMDDYAAYTGDNNIYKTPRVRRAAHNLAIAGLQPGELPALMAWLKRQPWVKGADIILAGSQYLKWRDDTTDKTVDEQIEQVRTSHEPHYLGTVGDRLRRAQLQELEAMRG
jgi:hypothetical protein